MDFLVVPTLQFRLLYVWFVIEHGRRRVLHVDVTTHPTASWTIQQLREAFPGESSLRFLIHDNDSIFSDRVREAIEHLGMEPRPTATEVRGRTEPRSAGSGPFDAIFWIT